MNNVNSHIEKYLNEYFESQHNPKFAVMLQGEWGCGKTWFIKKFIKDFDRKKGTTDRSKFLYISLYSIKNLTEIEDQIFQQLHPVLSSKPMAITGKILKGVIRSSIKLDFDVGDKTQGDISANISDLKIPRFLKNVDDRILIFDDLERCLMPPERILGYINAFVEHQGLRVIVIANEKELKEYWKSKERDGINPEDREEYKKLRYSRIKEKLIGKTFRVLADSDSAFDSFVKDIRNIKFKELIRNSKSSIINIFTKANYKNLRHLQQSLWEFERIYPDIPDRFKEIPHLIFDLLSVFLVYSFEIKAGKIEHSDIIDYSTYRIKKYSKSLRRSTDEHAKEISEPIDEVIEKYDLLEISDTILPIPYWKKLFDDGYLSSEEFEVSLSKSRYCQDDNTPKWVRLWYHRDLEDDDFEIVLNNVKTQWENREFKEPGLILHVIGLFLGLSELGLYQSNKEAIEKDSIRYIDELKKLNLLIPRETEEFRPTGTGVWAGLGYAGQETKEFKEISDYLVSKINEIKINALPEAGMELLDLLSEDTEKFRSMIAPDAEGNNYHRTPIFKYISPQKFMESLLKVKNTNKKSVAYALKARYEYTDTAKSLIEELDFLKILRSEIDQEIEQRKGKISGCLLGFIKKPYLNDIITRLEKFKAESSEAEKV